jgi:hypothetical protein
METLAYLHLALAYEESPTVEAVNLLENFNLFGLLKYQKNIYKAWIYTLSLSLTLVLLRVFSSALALELGEHGYQVSDVASESISKTEPKQNIRKSSPISNLISKIEPTQNRKNNSPASSSNSITKPKHHLHTQDGKLLFVNDTRYTALVFLYKPGENQPNRYVNIRPCTRRQLRATYSNIWGVSLNDQKKVSLDQVSVKRGDFFEIQISKLNQLKETQESCQYQDQLQATEPVLDPRRLTSQHTFENSHKAVKAIKSAVAKLPKNLQSALANPKNREILLDIDKNATKIKVNLRYILGFSAKEINFETEERILGFFLPEPSEPLIIKAPVQKQKILQEKQKILQEKQKILQEKQKILQEKQERLQEKQERLQEEIKKEPVSEKQERLQEEQERLQKEQERLQEEQERLQGGEKRIKRIKEKFVEINCILQLIGLKSVTYKDYLQLRIYADYYYNEAIPRLAHILGTADHPPEEMPISLNSRTGQSPSATQPDSQLEPILEKCAKATLVNPAKYPSFVTMGRVSRCNQKSS